MAAIIAVNYVTFLRLARSMEVFELAEELNSTILEMRRYEKNYFLYRQAFNYEENAAYTSRLELLLARDRPTLLDALGSNSYNQFQRHVQQYARAMESLHHANCAGQDCEELQRHVRSHGHNLLLLAEQMVDTERRSINKRLQALIPLPLLSLVVLLLLLGFVVFVIGENVVRPLARITRESEAVASGLFQRITPYGREGNEIHAMVSTINRMMDELEKRQEQLIQSRKIASIGTLTAGIAHEINNPLNNISLILESMLESGDAADPEEREKLLQDAVDQTDRASEIVKNLLEFSRVSRPRIENVDLEELVDKTARLVKNELKLHQIEFHKEVRDSLPTLQLDRGGLQQVLLNLMMNSIQATPPGGHLTVALGKAEDRDEVRLDVIDTGVGIPKENLIRIFDPFFTTKKEGVGTGLGLSVSYNIVNKNGGRMEVDSEVGKGTRFSIFFPLPGGIHGLG